MRRWWWSRLPLTALILALGVTALRRARHVRPSVQMRFVKAVLRLTIRNSNPADLHRTSDTRASPQAAPLPASLRALCDVQERQVQGCTVYSLTPKQGASGWHFLSTHGGAYVNALTRFQWEATEALIRHTGAVTVPLYPLAPEHTFQTAHALLGEVYHHLLSRTPAGRVVLCSDSAGGGLALGLALRARDLGQPQPSRVVLFAPWLDLTLSDPKARAVEPRDVCCAWIPCA